MDFNKQRKNISYPDRKKIYKNYEGCKELPPELNKKYFSRAVSRKEKNVMNWKQ